MCARSRTPDYCPNCGAGVPPNAKSCPECGSDESTGWSDDAEASGLGLPDDSFNYQEFVKEEFGDEKQFKPKGIRWHWWMVALGLVLVLGFVLFCLL